MTTEVSPYYYRKILKVKDLLNHMVILSENQVECENCGDVVGNVWQHIKHHEWLVELHNTAQRVYDH